VVWSGAIPGKGGEVNVYAPGSSGAVASLLVNDDGSGSVQATASGGKGLKLDGETKSLLIESDEGTASLGGGGDGWGLFIAAAGGQPLANLAKPDGHPMGLRIYSSGQPSVEVDSNPSMGGSIRLFGDGEKAAVSLQSTGEGTGLVKVLGTSETSGVTIDGEKELLTVSGDKGKVGLGSIAGGWGLSLGDKAGTPQAELSQPSGKGMALRFLSGGKQIAAIGHLPGEGGAVYVFSENGMPAAAMDTIDGGGNVRAYGSSRQPVAALVGKANAVEVYNSTGVAVAALRLAESGSGGKVSAGDPGGSEVFKGGYDPDGPGGACVSRKGWKCLGIGLTGMEGMH
jgi:hypothetical protein